MFEGLYMNKLNATYFDTGKDDQQVSQDHRGHRHLTKEFNCLNKSIILYYINTTILGNYRQQCFRI